MQTHRQIAKRRTVVWQGAAVAVLCAAGAAIALPGVRSFLAPGPPPAKKVFVDVAPVKPVGGGQNLALAEAVASLKTFSPWVEPPKVEAPKVVEMGIAPPPPPPPPVGDLVYLGSIITPSSRSALIRVDNAQQILGLGNLVSDNKLVTIEPDYIEVERGGVKKRIDQAQRTLLMPTEASKKPVAFRPPPTLPGGAGGAGSPMAVGNIVHQPGAPGSAGAPATFEQARMAALAAREAAARAAAPQAPPQPGQPNGGEVDVQKYDQAVREEATKYLMEPNLQPELRDKYLRSIGITPGTSVEQATAIMQKIGLDPNSDAGRGAMESIIHNSKAESKEGK